jgi:hypothetical protein
MLTYFDISMDSPTENSYGDWIMSMIPATRRSSQQKHIEIFLDGDTPILL